MRGIFDGTVHAFVSKENSEVNKFAAERTSSKSSFRIQNSGIIQMKFNFMKIKANNANIFKP